MSQTSAMNFLPEDYVEKRQAARTAVICVGLLVVVVSGIVAAWTFTQWHAKSIFDLEAQVNAQFDEANKQIVEAQEIDREKAKMMAKAELTTMLMEKVRRSSLLEEMTKLQPKGVNLVSLELKSKEIAAPTLSEIDKAKLLQDGKPLPPEKPPEIQVTIDVVGTAMTDGQMAAYVKALNRSSLLSDVNMVFSEETKRGTGDAAETVRKFHLQMKINPAADLRQMSGSEALTDASMTQ